MGEGEKEEVVPVLHIRDGRLMAHRSSRDAACIRFPCLRSMNGGPQLGFQTWHETEPVWAALFISPAC
jgi:hypothetical protein